MKLFAAGLSSILGYRLFSWHLAWLQLDYLLYLYLHQSMNANMELNDVTVLVLNDFLVAVLPAIRNLLSTLEHAYLT